MRIKDETEIIQKLWSKVTFDVTTKGSQATVTCRLPAVFTMPVYTRIYDLRHASGLGMSAKEYIEFQHDKLKEDLFNRLPLDKRRLLTSVST